LLDYADVGLLAFYYIDKVDVEIRALDLMRRVDMKNFVFAVPHFE